MSRFISFKLYNKSRRFLFENSFKYALNRHHKRHLTATFLLLVSYYTIIDFNEIDMRIYLPEKVVLPRNIFTNRSKAVLLVWIIFVFLSCVWYAIVRIGLFVPCGQLTSWLSFVMSNCEFVTFPFISWVWCGT